MPTFKQLKLKKLKCDEELLLSSREFKIVGRPSSEENYLINEDNFHIVKGYLIPNIEKNYKYIFDSKGIDFENKNRLLNYKNIYINITLKNPLNAGLSREVFINLNDACLFKEEVDGEFNSIFLTINNKEFKVIETLDEIMNKINPKKR